MSLSWRRVLLGSAVAALLGALAACGGGESAAEGGRESPKHLPDGTQIPADAASRGMFGPVQPWPLVAVHGVMLPDGRILSYGSKEDGQQTAFFNYAVWDPETNTHQTFPNGTGVDIFCSAPLLADAGSKVFIAGGDNWLGPPANVTTNTGNDGITQLDTATLALSRPTNDQGFINLNRPRWYATTTMLLNGEIYVQGGTGGTDRPEVRQLDGSMRLLAGADTSTLSYFYPRNFVAPDGRIFGFDANGRMYYVDPSGSGSITMAGQFSSAFAGSDSSAAMYAPGRILQFGGNSNQAAVIDINGATPLVLPTASMLRQRRLAVGTILANGEVVATGGSREWNVMNDVSYEAEIWNPDNGTWTVGASMQKPRLYHGNALLLADATVLVFGGGSPAPAGVPPGLHAEIYYPPYLFDATGLAPRPEITAGPTVVDVGRTIQVTTQGARPIRRVTFVKAGSATHAFNMEQRFVDLPFSANGGQLAVQVPSRAAVVPPGMWMMFVIDDAGVPSKARLMRVNVAGQLDTSVAPQLTSPGPQATPAGVAVDLPAQAADPNADPLTFTASGLPAGLSIDPATGRITGTPTVVGLRTVVLAVSDGFNSASVTFNWEITGQTGIVVQPLPPTTPTVVGGVATFTASASGTDLRYRWDFGDGTPVTAWSVEPSAAHVYNRVGRFYVTVEVVDGSGIGRQQTIVHDAHLPLTAQAPTGSSNLLYQHRPGADARIWVVNPDNDSVTVFNATTYERLAEVPVGRGPRTLALAPDAGSVWVTNRDSATLTRIDATGFNVTGTIALPRGSLPYGIVFARASNAALVALEGTGGVMRVDAASGALLGSRHVGQNPRHLAVAADGATAYVSLYVTPPLPGESTGFVQTQRNGQPAGGEVVVVDAGSLAVLRTIVLQHGNLPDAENQGRGFPNYLGAMAISPDGSQAFVPSKLDNLKRGAARDGLPLNFQNTVRAVSSRVLMATQSEDLAARIDHDNASVASAAAFDPLGIYLFVALETSREVAVLDAHTRAQIMRIDVGRAPQGLAVAPDRSRLYVTNFMDRSVGVYDLTALIQSGQLSVPSVITLQTVTTEALPTQVLRGKQFFYDARDTRLARDRYMSCASCHNDGGHDGRVWDMTGFGEGLRATINLRGRGGAAHGPLHWTNNFDEVQDFEGQIRTLAGGSGLMTDTDFHAGTRSQPLGDPKAGISPDLDALAAYVSSLDRHDLSPARRADGTLSAAAQAGQSLFATLNCAACHGGSAFTRSGVISEQDIGTLKATSGKRLSDTLAGIDVPTLRDAWATGPYLHDGSAPTLAAAIRAHAIARVAALGGAELASLEAYVREIGADEAAAPSMSTEMITGGHDAATASVDLTALGAADWVKWGEGGVPGVVRKNGVAALIGELTTTGTAAPTIATDYVRRMSWTDGAPTASATGAGDALRVPGIGNGFRLLVAAGTRPRTLTLYVGGNKSAARLTARIVGGTGLTYSAVTPLAGTKFFRTYTITFSADSEGRQLEVAWINVSPQGTASSSVAFTAAALSLPATVPNLPPLLSVPATQQSAVGASASLQVSASDAEFSSLGFSAVGLPPGLSIHPSTGLISGQPSTPGDYYPLVRAVDAGGAGASASFRWIVGGVATIGPSNGAPVVQASPPLAAWLGQPVSAQMAASDPDGDLLDFSARDLPPGLSIDRTSGLVGGVPTAAGHFVSTVQAIDGQGHTGSATVAWTVSPPPTDRLQGQVSSATDEVNLTQIGTADWAKWGEQGGVPGVVRKAGVAAVIGNPEIIGIESTPGVLDNDLRTFYWNDGVEPIAANVSTNRLRVGGGPGRGFRILIPVDLGLRTVTLQLGGNKSAARLTARLLGSAQPEYSFVTEMASGRYARNVALEVQAAGAGRFLEVTWVNESEAGDVSIAAAAISVPAGNPWLRSPRRQMMTVGQTAALQIVAGDTNGDPLVFSASGLPAGTSIDPATGRVTGAVAELGVFSPVVTVADGRGGVASTAFEWEVRSAQSSSVQLGFDAENTPVDLTATGADDWIDWGNADSIPGPERKAGVPPLLAALEVVGTGLPSVTAGGGRAMAWTDGTSSTAATNNRSVVRMAGKGSGFRLRVPAGTIEKVLTVYVGGNKSAGRLIAQIAGEPETAVADVSEVVGTGYIRTYHIRYKAAQDGRELEVMWTHLSSKGNVFVGSAALAPASR
ncbi:MAG: DUF1929 domain-containing protein [Burkholderiales bacterium]|nr:DUF1929 domain-containing protein [Burkholderiales bacterium]